MIVAADDVGDIHVVVVDHHREHVGGRAVRAQDDEIVEVLGLEHDFALHVIVHHDLARLRRLDADDRLDPSGGLGRIAVAPAAVVARRLSGRAGLLAHLRQLFLRAVAVIGLSAIQQFLRDLGVPARTRKLHGRLAVPLQPQPRQSFENGLHGIVGRSFAVRVLDAQQKPAAGVPGKGPAKQGRPGAADMQVAGRRGSEAGDDVLGHEVRNAWCLRCRV